VRQSLDNLLSQSFAASTEFERGFMGQTHAKKAASREVTSIETLGARGK
jgi:hypothetical protein